MTLRISSFFLLPFLRSIFLGLQELVASVDRVHALVLSMSMVVVHCFRDSLPGVASVVFVGMSVGVGNAVVEIVVVDGMVVGNIVFVVGVIVDVVEGIESYVVEIFVLCQLRISFES